MKPTLAVNEIKDPFVQENFKKLDEFFRANPLLNGDFKHFEIILDDAVADYNFKHNLNFVPKDLIQTFLTDGITLTWNFDDFTNTDISFTTSGACTVRFFLGRYRKEFTR